MKHVLYARGEVASAKRMATEWMERRVAGNEEGNLLACARLASQVESKLHDIIEKEVSERRERGERVPRSFGRSLAQCISVWRSARRSNERQYVQGSN